MLPLLLPHGLPCSLLSGHRAFALAVPSLSSLGPTPFLLSSHPPLQRPAFASSLLPGLPISLLRIPLTPRTWDVFLSSRLSVCLPGAPRGASSLRLATPTRLFRKHVLLCLNSLFLPSLHFLPKFPRIRGVASSVCSEEVGAAAVGGGHHLKARFVPCVHILQDDCPCVLLEILEASETPNPSLGSVCLSLWLPRVPAPLLKAPSPSWAPPPIFDGRCHLGTSDHMTMIESETATCLASVWDLGQSI